MNKATLQNGLLIAVSVFISLIACELLFRTWLDVPLLQFRNLADGNVVQNTMGTAEYDSLLGWRPIPNKQYHFGSEVLTQLEHGIRGNGTGDPAIRTGGILAVGDSFTAGSEASDNETWPAILERKAKIPVVNGAAGAYGTDQIVLRAEQLLPLVRPKVLLVGFLMADIERAGYSSFGRPKPYFMLDQAGLTLHNNPVPLSAPGDRPVPWWKKFLAHSYVGDRIMYAISGPLWYRLAEQQFVRVANDQVGVTCRLLQRLKRQTDADGIRTLLVMQHGGAIIHLFDGPRPLATQVVGCARQIGIQVVDEFEALKAIDRQGPDALKPYYHIRNDQYGHMTELGNGLIASLIETALQEAPTRGGAENYVPQAFVPGDGKNLIPKSETLETLVGSSAIASFTPVAAIGSAPRVYRLSAAGSAGEHYVGIGPLPGEAGFYTLSMEAKAAGGTCLFLQILDEPNNGVLSEVNLATGSIGGQPLGKGQDIGGDVTTLDDGWQRLWVSVKTAANAPRILLQLADAKCSRAFKPNGEAILLRKVQLERGQSASTYALHAAPATGVAKKPIPKELIPGDGKNLIAKPESLEMLIATSTIASFSPVDGPADKPRVYRLSAVGPAGEHYVGLGPLAGEAGFYNLSMEAKAAGTSCLFLQILDDGNNGVIGEANLAAATIDDKPLGLGQETVGAITPSGDGWHRIWISVKTAAGAPRILLQLGNAGCSRAFEPKNESMLLRKVQLERGQTASAYAAPSAEPTPQTKPNAIK